MKGVDNPENEPVISKWCYKFDLNQKSKIVIGLHQEDVRIVGVASRRPFIDMGKAN